MKREQKTSGLRRILNHPAVYDAYDALVGTRGVRRAFVGEYVQAFPGAHVLDLGCGSGNLLRYLPGVAYTGVDISSVYIRTAQTRYGDRGTFILGSAIDADLGPDHSFDIVVAFALLHHVNDVTAREVVSRAKQALRPGGRFVTLDPCFEARQNRFARFLHKKDRGRHVRYVDAYLKLAHTAFDAVTARVLHNMHPVVPSTTLIMTCVSPPSGPPSVQSGEQGLDHAYQASRRKLPPMSRVETEWIEFASSEELRDEKVIVKWIANHEVAVTFRDGSIRAFSNVCPHKGGPLHEGPWTSDGQIRCPWHGYQFDLKTGRCLGRPDLSVRLFHWREQDGKILITFGSAKP